MKVIPYLYNRYYTQESIKSDATSSHWAEHGIKDLEIHNGNIKLEGMGGFGDYIPLTNYTILRNFIHIKLINSYLKKFSQRKDIEQIARAVAKESKRLFLLDCAKHVVALERILTGLKSENFNQANVRTVCIIGDGYGYFGNLIKKFDPSVKIIFVNLGKQLIFDAQVSKNINPTATLNLIDQASYSLEEDNSDFLFIEAENYHLLKGLSIDLYINIASMQEMDKTTVDKYFELIKSSSAKRKLFYCCNRKHKTLPDGQDIIFDEYHWGDSKVHHEEDTAWYKFYTCQRPPFWRPYDGDFKAKLVQF